MASVQETPGVRLGSDGLTEEQRRLKGLERAKRERQKQSLSLQREQILSQRTSSPLRRQALEAALAQIESQLKALD